MIRNGTFKMEKIGSWSQYSGLIMTEAHSKFDRRKNLDGLTFLGAITVKTVGLNLRQFNKKNSNSDTATSTK